MTIGAEFPTVLAASQAGAEWAFAVLYRELNPRVVRYFAAHAHGVAEDLASETWLSVARALTRFAGNESDFRAWLFTIAHRRLVQHWRDTGRRPSTPSDPDALPELPATEDTEALGLAALNATEAAQTIRAALSADQAQIVLLRILGGLSVEEVAAAVGKRPATVRVLQHRALRRLAGKFSVEPVTG